MTWDTLDTQPYCTQSGLVVLSGSNLIATGGASLSSNNNGLATPFEGKTSGKWCVEIHCIASGGVDAIGVTTASAIALAGGNGYGFIGSTGGSGYVGQFGIGYRQDGDINGNRLYLIGQHPLATWGTWGAGDYVYVAIDLDNSSVWWRVNGGAWVGSTNTGDPASNSGGIALNTAAMLTIGAYRIFPAASMGNTGQYTFNFGATSFAHAAPSGFTAGWTNTGLRNFGSFLSNGIGGFLSGTKVAVSPYVSGFTGKVSQIVGVGCSGNNTQAVGVIYDSDGSMGAPGTLLGQSGVQLGGTEVTYNLVSPVTVTSSHTYYLGVFYHENGAIRSIPISGGGSNGLWQDTAAVWPTPGATFTVSSQADNHLPMLAQFPGAGGGAGYTFGEII